jgi:hypothetical protein
LPVQNRQIAGNPAEGGTFMTTQETIERIETKINKLPLIDSEVVGIITPWRHAF